MANNEKILELLNSSKEAAEKALEVARKALASKDLTQYNAAMKDLDGKVKTWNEYICKAKYNEFLASETPMITAVKEFFIETQKIKVSKDKNDGSTNGINFEKKKTRIDLEKFCEHGELDTTWAKDCEKLLALFNLRETDIYAMKPADLAKKSIYFIAQVKAKENGETPDSNTKIVRLLQKIIDEAIFVDDGSGKNVYKCTNHDIAFIQDSATKMDTKEKCTIAMLNDRQFKNVMMSVFAHCLGEAYKVKAIKVKK